MRIVVLSISVDTDVLYSAMLIETSARSIEVPVQLNKAWVVEDDCLSAN